MPLLLELILWPRGEDAQTENHWEFTAQWNGPPHRNAHIYLYQGASTDSWTRVGRVLPAFVPVNVNFRHSCHSSFSGGGQVKFHGTGTGTSDTEEEVEVEADHGRVVKKSEPLKRAGSPSSNLPGAAARLSDPINFSFCTSVAHQR